MIFFATIFGDLAMMTVKSMTKNATPRMCAAVLMICSFVIMDHLEKNIINNTNARMMIGTLNNVITSVVIAVSYEFSFRSSSLMRRLRASVK
jgi:hypothetical protein